MQYASDYGYLQSPGLHLDCADYEFVPMATMITADYDWYDPATGWRSIGQDTPGFVGLPIETHYQPIRRKRRRWACGHGKEQNDMHCRVCIVFARNVME